MNLPILKDEIAEMFDKELIDFLALRYNRSAEEIINQFLIQNGGDTSVCPPPCQQKRGFTLESNEMEILRAYYNK